MKKTIRKISSEINEVMENIDSEEASRLYDFIKKSKRVFIAGAGRSGLVGKIFGMRLMHSGYSVYIVGETTTPSIQSGDLLIVMSGSGNTGTMKLYASKAKVNDAAVALLTTNKESQIGELADCKVVIPAATKKRLKGEPDTIQPLGSQFDQALHLLLDAIIIPLLEGKDTSKLVYQHANLE